MTTDISAERLRQIFEYDAGTGVFRWSPGHRNAGKEVGRVHYKYGYIIINIKNRRYLAHRLAWLYIYGEWPSMYIDHRDGNPGNNAINNLRLASNSLNQANRIKSSKTILPKGVTYHKKCNKYQAAIKVNQKSFHLGLYPTPEEAHNAYMAAAKRYFGGYARAS